MGPNVARYGTKNRWAPGAGGLNGRLRAMIGGRPLLKCARRHGTRGGREQLRVFRNQRTMRATRIGLGWSKTLWEHMWIDQMYAYVAKWGTLGRFSSFTLEGAMYGSRG